MIITTAPRLRIRRPSPTAAEFTVTTQPAPTVTLRALRALLAALRVAVALVTLLLLYARCAGPAAALGGVAVLRAAPLAAAAAVLFLVARRAHAHESLLVLRGLGVQTSESARSYLAGGGTRFIPTEKIQDILVNEAFRGFEVRYYLLVVVEGEDDVVVVFPGLLPRRDIVETVWRGARECLCEGRANDKAPTA